MGSALFLFGKSRSAVPGTYAARPARPRVSSPVSAPSIMKSIVLLSCGPGTAGGIASITSTRPPPRMARRQFSYFGGGPGLPVTAFGRTRPASQLPPQRAGLSRNASQRQHSRLHPSHLIPAHPIATRTGTSAAGPSHTTATSQPSDPKASSFFKNAVTRATRSPPPSINRTGSHGSSRITTAPTAGTTSVDRSRSRSASPPWRSKLATPTG